MYIEDLFSSVCRGAHTIMVDQIVPPTNLNRYLRYFNDIKVFVVDRDPRDIFVLEKYVWKDGVIPSDVEEFCKWFKYTRAHRKTERFDNDRICFIQFEDMIYKYEETTKKIADWLGFELNEQTKKKQYFDPNRSINNTCTWKRVKCNPAEIKYIEKELNEYLYSFT